MIPTRATRSAGETTVRSAGALPSGIVRRSVLVAVPARDERALLGRCLEAVAAAAGHVSAHADVHVVVAADACTDDTEAVAAAALAGQHASIVRVAARNVGATRAAAVAAGSAIFRPALSDPVWIAMTDADSVVPLEWLAAQLRAADAGFDAVVGAITVDDWTGRRRPLDADLRRYRRAQRHAGSWPVHGANLGVSAAALAAIGGVPAQALSEDAALVHRLIGAGRAVLWDPELVVRTSARRSRRAPGGFSALLDALERHDGVVA